jgi:hypothetical protein
MPRAAEPGSALKPATAGWPVAALCLLVTAVFAPGFSLRRVFFVRDLGFYFYPAQELAWRMICQGTWPLWNPYSGFGTPLAAMADVLLYYPGTWLRFPLPQPLGFNLSIVAHFYLAALSAYALGRRLAMSRTAAFGAAAAFTFAGPLLSLGSMLNVLVAAAWMPLVLLASMWAVEQPGTWRVLILGSALAMQAIGGEPLLSIATAMLALALCCGSSQPLAAQLRRFFRVFVPAALFGMALIAVQLLPGLELLRKSVRQQQFGFPQSSFWSLHPLNLLETVLPGALAERGSLPLRQYLYGAAQPYLASLYLGVLALGLAAVALVRSGHKAARRTAICGGLFLLFSFGAHSAFYTPLYWLLPMVRQSRYPSKLMVAGALCIALLTGWGVDALGRRARPQWWWLKWVVALLAGLALRAVLAEAGTTTWAWRELSKTMQGLAGWVEALRLVCALLLLVIVLWLARSHGRAAAALAAFALALDLAYTGHSVNPTAPLEVLTARSPLVAKVGGGSSDFRVDGDAEALPGRLPLVEDWPVAAVSMFEARAVLQIGAPLAGVRDARDLSPNKLYTPAYRGVRLQAQDWMARGRLAALGRWNVRYFITDADKPPPPGVRQVATVSVLSRRLAVWEMESWRPRVEIAGGAARIVDESPNRVVIQAESATGGSLVLRDSYDDGWRARVDGQPARLERTEEIFRLVRIPAGRHAVDFAYRPWTFLAGAAISACALLALLAFTIARLRAPGNPKPTEPRA